MIKLQFLGPVTIRKEDGSLDQTIPKGAKRVALLAYLVLAKPRGYHRRDELLTLFWPDAGQKSARNALSNILYYLRNALGKDIILNRGSEEICVNMEKVWCDVLAFESAVDQGELKKAFELYKSRLLTGFHINHVSNDFQDWLDRERERLQKAYSGLCWNLAMKEKGRDNFEFAHHYAQKAADLTPYSDKHQSRYIKLLAEIGKPEAARRAYDRYSERLKTELNADPSPDLRGYVENIDASQSVSASAEDVNASGDGTRGLPIVEPGSSADLPNSDKDLKVQPKNLYEPNQNSSNKKLIRNIFISVVFVLIAWFIGNYFFNSGTDIQFGEKSVAVLPFTYINSPDSTDYFSLGITEEILSKLARKGDLSVTSRTSIMQYRNSDKSIREIAGELGVTTIVEGSIQRHSGQVRVTAQLIDAETDRHLWADTYDRQIENILDIQSDVAGRIADALQTKLVPNDNSEYNPQQNVDELAYQKYLQAKYLLDMGNAENIVEAVEVLEESISIDSTFAPAHGNLSLAYMYSGLVSTFPLEHTGVEGINIGDATNLALEASNKALSINSNVVEAYMVQGIIHRLNKEWDQSEEKFLKALSLNPNHSDVLREYGALLTKLGNNEEALIQKEKAVEVDPLAWNTHIGLGYSYYCERRYVEAIRELETSLSLGSRYFLTKKFLGLARLKRGQELFNNGQDEQAMAMIEKGSSNLNEFWGTNIEWKESITLAMSGDKQKALQHIKENSLSFSPKLHWHLLIGQKETALEMIDRGVDLSRFAYIDPVFDTVRDDLRFQQMAERDLKKEIDFD
ncbi:MAG: BTAD domain-containing putative transcriptional regulator [Bacteroidales bacterium]